MEEFSYQWYYDLTIRVSLEVVWCLQCFSNDSVVVYFAIDSKGNALILVGKRLSSTVNTNNTQTFVGENLEVLVTFPIDGSPGNPLTCAVGHVASGPIWTTMSALLHHLQSRRLECLRVWDMAVWRMSQFKGQESLGQFREGVWRNPGTLMHVNIDLLTSYNPAHLAGLKCVSWSGSQLFLRKRC